MIWTFFEVFHLSVIVGNNNDVRASELDDLNVTNVI